MPAYWTARARINDPVAYEHYTDRFQRFVVVEFPSLERAVRCHRSPEYREAAAFRRAPGVSEVEPVIAESGDPTPT